MVENICTIADHRAYDELLIMIKSLSLFMEIDIHVAGDRDVVERLRGEKFSNRVMTHQLIPDGMQAHQGHAGWADLMVHKMGIMDIALSEAKSTAFIDADIIFYHALWGIDLEKYEVALSGHMILPADEERFGRFNGGYIATSQPRFPRWWRDGMSTSRYSIQGCLDQTGEEFKMQELTVHHNFGWWRLNQCDPKHKWWRIDLASRPERARRLSRFQVRGDQVLYDEQPLVSIHTHIKDRKKTRYQSANRLAIDLLERSANPKHKQILSWL